jgi:hypothetical protein
MGSAETSPHSHAGYLGLRPKGSESARINRTKRYAASVLGKSKRFVPRIRYPYLVAAGVVAAMVLVPAAAADDGDPHGPDPHGGGPTEREYTSLLQPPRFEQCTTPVSCGHHSGGSQNSSVPSAPNPLQDYLTANNIVPMLIQNGDRRAPSIDIPPLPGWSVASSDVGPLYDGCCGVFALNQPQGAAKITTTAWQLNEIGGQGDPAMILQLWPSSLELLPDWHSAGDATRITLSGFDAIRQDGSATEDGKKVILTQTLVVIPAHEPGPLGALVGGYALQLDGIALAGQEGPLMDATDLIEKQTTITGQRATPAVAEPSGPIYNFDVAQLSGGYTPADCHSDPPRDKVVAAVGCGANHHPGGPAQAMYLKFANTDDLNGTFNKTVAQGSVQPFPDGTQGPNDWTHPSSPDQRAGTRAIVTFPDGDINVLWTNDAELMMGMASSHGDPAALYNWWAAEG